MTQSKTSENPAVYLLPLQHGVQDDFTGGYVTADKWTTVAASTGTCAVGDAVGGVMTILTAATDNDDTFLKQTDETFKMVSGKTIKYRAKVAITEGNTDDCNAFFGLINAAAANDMIDDGGGPRANFFGAAFYKLDGGTNWNVAYSAGTTQTLVELNATNNMAAAAAVPRVSDAYQFFGIEITPYTSLKANVVFTVHKADGTLQGSYKMTDVTYASATEMQVTNYIKAGGANVETMLVDYVACEQVR